MTAWIRAFFFSLFFFLNKAIQQSTDGALQTPIWCECEKEIYQTGQGHLHKASVRSTVHLQIEQRRRAKVKKRNQKKSEIKNPPSSQLQSNSGIPNSSRKVKHLNDCLMCFQLYHDIE